jgi:hypothetical protein
VLAPDAVDSDLEIGNAIEQWQIADRAMDMLVDPLARPAAAVAVQRDAFSGPERDVDLIGIALAAFHAGGIKAFSLTECIEQCLTLVHDLSSITCDRSETRPLLN